MKYGTGILLSILGALCITGIFVTLSFTYVFSPQHYIETANQPDQVATKKAQIKHSVDSVAMANNIEPEIYEPCLTDARIRQNNKAYFENVFAYITRKSDILKTDSAAADAFAAEARERTEDYLEENFASGEYDGTEEGMNAYISSLRESFYSAAEPVTGFQLAATLMRKYSEVQRPMQAALFAGLFICIVLIFVLNLKNLRNSVVVMLYMLSGGGLLTAIGGGLLTAFIQFKDSILQAPGIRGILTHSFVTLLIMGAVLFLVTQVLLALVFRMNKNTRKNTSL